ncbi:EAL domain-containing protein [Deinococcus psychrotolerans]|uniref:EAL domain-containing protein n=1 Tax=Deinococcus psychrotolerans TaxID=2489213 RepID=A0A3G8YCD0_9DEIO|nr:EAL domain-containing protein [Deinococcus psychrotolerans]AZI42583.1 EAL domain-containing protein [Deinococcus psychrotolerans]
MKPSQPTPQQAAAQRFGSELEQHKRALLLLDRVRETLTGAPDLPSLFHEVTAAIQQVVGYPLVSIALVEDEQIKPQVSLGYDTEGVIYSTDFGIIGRVARSAQAALVQDVSQDADYQVYHPKVISQLCLPLFDGQQVAGLLNIETTDFVLGEEDLRLMQILSQHLSSALRRVRLDVKIRKARQHDQYLYAQITRQASELALLHQVRNALSREVSVDSLIRAVNTAIIAAFGYTQVSIYLLDPAALPEPCLVLQHQIGYDTVLPRIPVSMGVVGRVIRTGKGELIEDVRLEAAFVGAIDNITSEVTVPLRAHGKVVGTLNVESVDGVTLHQRDLELMDEVAAQVGQALERAQLLSAVSLSESRYRLLAESMTDLVCLHAREGQLTYVSPSVTALLGYLPEDILGQFPDEFVHPDDHEKIKNAILQTPSPQFDLLRLRLRHQQGHWIWFETSSAPVQSGDGQWQSTSRDISERHHIEQQLAYEARHDSLTGLANRSLFEGRLQACLEEAQQTGNTNYAVLFLDVDRFKVINDSLGHRIGDDLLRALAERLAANIPPNELLARLGGDEFAILLSQHAPDAERLAGRLTKALRQPLKVGGHDLRLSISIGIAPGRAEYTETGDVLRDADLSMYESKHRQRTRASSAYRVFDRSLHERALRRLQIEAELGAAIEARQLHLFYQPVVQLSSNRILGFEALARWQHSELGAVQPSEFLSVAEETGLIWPLGQWVLEEACQQLSLWQQQQPERSLHLNVNLSPHQFQQSDVIRQVQRAIRKSGCAAHGLNLEITEGAMLHASAAQTITALRELGLGVQVDDFGTGYSSLASLHRFNLTALKIDRSFVENLGSDPASQGIVQAILKLAEALKLDVIAEGIETSEQRRSLLDLDCQVGQGYLFSPAVSAVEATKLWQRCGGAANEGGAAPTQRNSPALPTSLPKPS